MKKELVIEIIRAGLTMEVLNKFTVLSDSVIIVNLDDGSKGIIATTRI